MNNALILVFFRFTVLLTEMNLVSFYKIYEKLPNSHNDNGYTDRLGPGLSRLRKHKILLTLSFFICAQI